MQNGTSFGIAAGHRTLVSRTTTRVVTGGAGYINPLIFPGDNRRVLGYDAAHRVHHRHYKGKVTAVSLNSFEKIEQRFQKEWNNLVKGARHAKD